MSYFMLAVTGFMAVMITPHILRMFKTGASRDQSLLGVWGVWIGMVCWIWYGVAYNDITIVVANIILVVVQSIYGLTAIYYRILPRDIHEKANS